MFALPVSARCQRVNIEIANAVDLASQPKVMMAISGINSSLFKSTRPVKSSFLPNEPSAIISFIESPKSQ